MFLDSAVNNYPDQPEAHYWFGTLYHDRANFKEMMVQFRKFNEIYAKAKAANDKKLVKNCEKDDMPKQIGKYKLSAFAKNSQEGVKQLKLADSLSKETRQLTDEAAKAEQEKAGESALRQSEQPVCRVCLTIDDTIAGVYTNSAWLKVQKGNTKAALDLVPEGASTGSERQSTTLLAGVHHFQLSSRTTRRPSTLVLLPRKILLIAKRL